jgi:hypothetical protein
MTNYLLLLLGIQMKTFIVLLACAVTFFVTFYIRAYLNQFNINCPNYKEIEKS